MKLFHKNAYHVRSHIGMIERADHAFVFDHGSTLYGLANSYALPKTAWSFSCEIATRRCVTSKKIGVTLGEMVLVEDKLFVISHSKT